MPATLAEIARQAGVSAPTVSKVLNGRAHVAPATRDKVEALLREHGYRRKRGAARPRPSGLLEIVFHELISMWATEIIRGAENVARQEGLTVVLSESSGREEMGLSWVDGVLTRDPAGVILVMSDLTAAQRELLVSRDVPFVVMDPAGYPADDVPSIGTTNWQGGYTATRHLLDLGHRRIGVIGGPESVLCSRARIDGYRAALETGGVDSDDTLVRHGTFQTEAGHHIAHELLSAPAGERPTALFAGNDVQAMGIYQAARELGLRIPEDVSVVGFDDLPVSAWMGPPLTTVRQPLVDMAEAAARLVLDLGRGVQPGMRRVELATSLVVRGSTAEPPEE
ncbi:LacI family DNA-binding transcriptional regulator [Streptomyces sp. NPDC021020]|uniref:LacI family DNA-binding transcriptional regulator n=1 Tax=Streptomyces sp. NPDC021020 TaxID=3365109 RepID=UPI00378D1567